MATTTGTLTKKVNSTVSSPTVNYSVTYTASTVAQNSDGTSKVSVKLDFTTWLNFSQSRLGKGIKLTVFARINSGPWQSAVIKGTSDLWSGTGRHTSSLTMSVNTAADSAKIQFYVSRTGSTISGTAGTLGSASNPKTYTATLPKYNGEGNNDDSSTSNPESSNIEKYVYVKTNGTWKKAVPYVKVNGSWKKVIPYVKVKEVWKSA